MLGHLEEVGAEARGQVGADDPILAFEDAVRSYRLLIRYHADWQERGLLEELKRRFDLPMTSFVIDSAGAGGSGDGFCAHGRGPMYVSRHNVVKNA